MFEGEVSLNVQNVRNICKSSKQSESGEASVKYSGIKHKINVKKFFSKSHKQLQNLTIVQKHYNVIKYYSTLFIRQQKKT